MDINQYDDNENFLSLQSLDLNFNKKKKSAVLVCSTTDRRNSQNPLVYQPSKTERNVLIQKKKNYSDAIRNRNLKLLSRKRSQISPFNDQRQLRQLKLNNNSKQTHKTKQLKAVKSRQNLSKYKQNNNKFLSSSNIDLTASSKFNETTMIFEEFSSSQIQEESSIILNYDGRYIEQRLSQLQIQSHEVKLDNQDIQKNRLNLVSNIYSQTFIVLDSDTTILMKQNATFKRDLANFRKQNSMLRKQLQNSKNCIEQLQTKTKYYLQQSEKSKNAQKDQLGQPNLQPSNSLQIIEKLRQQIQELKIANSTLQLKAYMAQKKIVQQVNSIKKKTAKQLQEWRQKCTKLRAENMRFKSYKDMTISMQISKDQQ